MAAIFPSRWQKLARELLVQLGYRPLVLMAVGMATGIALADGLELRFSAALLVLCAALAALALLLGQGLRATRLLLGVVFFSVGILLHSLHSVVPPYHLSNSLPLPAGSLAGRLVEPPTAARHGRHLLVDAQQVDTGRGWQATAGRVELFQVETDPPLRAGDQVVVRFSHLAAPPEPRNPGETDARKLAQRQGWCGRGSALTVEATHAEPPVRGRLADFVARRQQAAQAALEQAMPGDRPDYYAALLGGMVFGRRAAGPVDNETGDLFRRTGAVHLLVVSGGKITFIIGLLVLLIGWRGRRALQPWHLLLIFPPILAFALFAGIAASVVRGLVMAAMMAVALVTHRDYDSFSAAALAALAMMIADTNAVFDVGAQLTFAGSLGVICFMPRPRLDEMTGRKVRASLLGRVFWASVGAWALTTPIIVATFHGMPLLGNLANVLAVPLLMLILPVGMLALLTGTWLLPVTVALCGVGRELIVALLAGMRVCAALPGAYVDLVYFGPWLTVAWYVVVAGGLLLVARRDLRERLLAGWRWRAPDRLFAVVGAVAALAVIVAVWPLASPPWLRVTIVAVGEGNCFLVQAPDGHSLMMDAGTSPDSLGNYLASDTLIPYLARRGVRRLDYFLLSHGDSDHCNALEGLLARVPLAHFVDPMTGGAQTYWQARAEVERRQIPVTIARAGVTLDLGGGVTAQVVEPEEPLLVDVPNPPNDNGAVALIRYGATAVLLTGDQQEAGIARLAAWARQYPGPVQVVVIPHHGRSARWCGDLLRQTRPQWALVSGSRGPAARQEIGDLAPVLGTGEVGAIEVVSDGREVRVRGYR